MICELLRQLVAIPSPTGSETELAIYCEQFLEQQGFQTQRQLLADGRFNLLAERGKAKNLLCAHLDTVPAADHWPHDPYTLLCDGDRLSGLGANDMKGGLAILLKLASDQQLLDLPLKIALTVDEEAWSAGAWQLIDSAWCQGLERVLIPEGVIDSQTPVIGYGRRGHGVFRLSFNGIPAHAAVLQSHAHTAIGQVASFIQQIPEIEQYLNAQNLACQIIVRQIESATVGLSVPAQSQCLLSCFSDPGTSLAQVYDYLAEHLAQSYPQATLAHALRPTPAPEAYALSPEQADLRQLAKAVENVTGRVAQLAIGVSPADENIYYQTLRLPVLSLAPVGSLAHQAGEWVSRASLEQIFKIYVDFLRSYS